MAPSVQNRLPATPTAPTDNSAPHGAHPTVGANRSSSAATDNGTPLAGRRQTPPEQGDGAMFPSTAANGKRRLAPQLPVVPQQPHYLSAREREASHIALDKAFPGTAIPLPKDASGQVAPVRLSHVSGEPQSTTFMSGRPVPVRVGHLRMEGQSQAGQQAKAVGGQTDSPSSRSSPTSPQPSVFSSADQRVTVDTPPTSQSTLALPQQPEAAATRGGARARRKQNHGLEGYRMPNPLGGPSSSSSVPSVTAVGSPATSAAASPQPLAPPPRALGGAHVQASDGVAPQTPAKRSRRPAELGYQMPTGQRSLKGLEPLYVANVPSFRDVNPLFSFDELEKKLPNDVLGCVAYMLSAERRPGVKMEKMEKAARDSAAILQSKGITSREDFINLSKSAYWTDTGTGILHGMANANGFGVSGSVVDFYAGDKLLAALAQHFQGAPGTLAGAIPGLLAGGGLGAVMSVFDIAAGASATKTFADAYYTRPQTKNLPEFMRGSNPHTKNSLANDMGIGAGLGYGLLRNEGIIFPLTTALVKTGHLKIMPMVNKIVSTTTGYPLGGGVMRQYRNVSEAGAGRGGLQHFFARTDLGECIDHMRKPVADKVGSAFQRSGTYGKNVVLTLREATKESLGSWTGLTSHAILGGLFAAVYAEATSIPPILTGKYGMSEENAAIATKGFILGTVQAGFPFWGWSLGRVSGPSSKTKVPSAQSEV